MSPSGDTAAVRPPDFTNCEKKAIKMQILTQFLQKNNVQIKPMNKMAD